MVREGERLPRVQDLRLRHYAREAELRFDPGFDYSDRMVRPDKPTGFWVSALGEDDWKSWCEAEHFATETLANEHEVRLAEDAQILLIDSLEQLRAFGRKYENPCLGPSLPGFGIDWELLYREFDGIVIAPYQWPARLGDGTRWYYGWDCASGCIWNLQAIASVERVQLLVEDGAR